MNEPMTSEEILANVRALVPEIHSRTPETAKLRRPFRRVGGQDRLRQRLFLRLPGGERGARALPLHRLCDGRPGTAQRTRCARARRISRDRAMGLCLRRHARGCDGRRLPHRRVRRSAFSLAGPAKFDGPLFADAGSATVFIPMAGTPLGLMRRAIEVTVELSREKVISLPAPPTLMRNLPRVNAGGIGGKGRRQIRTCAGSNALRRRTRGSVRERESLLG